MALSFRRAQVDDLFQIHRLNVDALPENYSMKYLFYHQVAWPGNQQIASTIGGSTRGYVMAKMDDAGAGGGQHLGHVTSLATHSNARRMGVAKKCMQLVHRSIEEGFFGKSSELHVRIGNKAGYGLYSSVLKYEKVDVEEAYYANAEDAYKMKLCLNPPNPIEPKSLQIG